MSDRLMHSHRIYVSAGKHLMLDPLTFTLFHVRTVLYGFDAKTVKVQAEKRG